MVNNIFLLLPFRIRHLNSFLCLPSYNVRSVVRFFATISLILIAISSRSQNDWVPIKNEIATKQHQSGPFKFLMQFKSNGPLGLDWTYGSYIGQNSKYRVAAYRQGGAWKPLPIYFNGLSVCRDIAMHGDTLVLLGAFMKAFNEQSSTWIPESEILYWHNDSLWRKSFGSYLGLTSDGSLASKGDSLIYSSFGYINTTYIIARLGMFIRGTGPTSVFQGASAHPTPPTFRFGAIRRLKILTNGDILIINNGSSIGNRHNGVVRFDGTRWYSYGKGIRSQSVATDIEFFRGDLIMCGNFSSLTEPNDPGRLVARWDSTKWCEIGGGITAQSATDLFVHQDILYCVTTSPISSQIRYGDAALSSLAGWDGSQWCGTPSSLPIPPTHFGFANDTLFASFQNDPGIVGTDSSVYLMYFDGDYLRGPNSVCSTLGLGATELTTKIPSFTAFPNPSDGALHISTNEDLKIEKVTVLDTRGKTISINDFFNAKYNVELDLSNLPSGTYLIKVNNHYVTKWNKL